MTVLFKTHRLTIAHKFNQRVHLPRRFPRVLRERAGQLFGARAFGERPNCERRDEDHFFCRTADDRFGDPRILSHKKNILQSLTQPSSQITSCIFFVLTSAYQEHVVVWLKISLLSFTRSDDKMYGRREYSTRSYTLVLSLLFLTCLLIFEEKIETKLLLKYPFKHQIGMDRESSIAASEGVKPTVTFSRFPPPPLIPPTPEISTTACVDRIADGNWTGPGGSWEWNAAARDECGMRPFDPLEARRLLAGMHVAFVGNSVQRRTMWALVDALHGGDGRAHRRGDANHNSTEDLIALELGKAAGGEEYILDYSQFNHAAQFTRIQVEHPSSVPWPESFIEVPRLIGLTVRDLEIGPKWYERMRRANGFEVPPSLPPPDEFNNRHWTSSAVRFVPASGLDITSREHGASRVLDVLKALDQKGYINLNDDIEIDLSIEWTKRPRDDEEAAAMGRPKDQVEGVQGVAGREFFRHTGTDAGQAMWIVFRMNKWERAEAFRILATSSSDVAELGTTSEATWRFCGFACREGPMRCAKDKEPPRPANDGEILLSFHFMGGNNLDGMMCETLGAVDDPSSVLRHADVIVFAGFNLDGERAASHGILRLNVFDDDRRGERLFLLRDFTHNEIDFPKVTEEAKKEVMNVAEVARAAAAKRGVVFVPVGRATMDGIALGVLHHEPGGYHFMDRGRSFIASTILHAIRLSTRGGIGVDIRKRSRREARILLDKDRDKLLRCEASPTMEV